jgi:NAD(P)H dehydrogenase (quinone)
MALDTAQRRRICDFLSFKGEETSVKHAVIFAHPKPESFTGSVASAYAKAASALGHEVTIRDLYRMNFQPCLQCDELPFTEGFRPRPDVVEERAVLRDVDVFVLCYPLWLDAPPAMMKGYLERVFGFGFAYGRDGHSEPLLSGRKLITFSSSGAPIHWVEQTGALGAIKTLFDRYFAEACGLTALDHVHFGGIVPGIRPDAVETRLVEVQDTVKKHFGRRA